MRTGILLFAFAGVTAIGPLPASAGPLPMTVLNVGASSDVVQVYHRGRPHRVYRYPRGRIVVHPRAYAYSGYYPDYYATYRGFQDPGFAVRGNMPGCAVDLGYGRWESCDK